MVDVDIDIGEHYEAMLDELSEMEDAEPVDELGDLLAPHAEDAIHEAYQHHQQNGNLDSGRS